jgi:prevent-host-death family protein
MTLLAKIANICFMTSPFKTAPATAVKNRFGDYLGEVLETHEPLYIDRHGKTVAVLVDIKRWLQKEALARGSQTPWCDGLKTLLKKARKRRSGGKSASAVDLLRELRDEES